MVANEVFLIFRFFPLEKRSARSHPGLRGARSHPDRHYLKRKRIFGIVSVISYVYLFLIYFSFLINVLFNADFKNAICFWQSHLFYSYHFQIYFAKVKINFSLMKINFALMKINFATMKINFALMKINFAPMKINFAPMKINFAPMKINFALMKINFALMKIDFALMKINFALMKINFAKMKSNFALIEICHLYTNENLLIIQKRARQ